MKIPQVLLDEMIEHTKADAPNECCGLIGGVGQLLLTEALRNAPIGVVAPFDYTQLVWAALLGLLVWGELPHPLTLVGAVIVAGSGVYILHRELQRFRAAEN